ncbi:MAG: SMP-30/gluconolactonase/LRE family protein [Myxococcales bacterium]|nr:SMP-30/gluconolactonase/LRE family protein [Myxococcales bacterium]MCB9737442.1 SMP-30/gluconolactonase/LRE family protein [Deltaproteobacteria bacterium]
MSSRLSALFVAASALALAPLPALAHGGGGGSTSQLAASIPGNPGYPEGVFFYGTRAYVTGPAAFVTAGSAASRVWVYDTIFKRIVDEIPLVGEDLAAEHAASGLAADVFGRLYILSTQLGVVRVTPYGRNRQEIYAPPLPDLPPCITSPAPCSPAPFDAPPLPNDIVFDRLGRAYVTDSLQATVFRIPYGGGTPEIWLQDPRFIASFGTNGLALSPDGRTLYVGVTGDPQPGAIYSVPIMDHPTPADVTLFHQYEYPDPDGMAFGASGKLYVTLAYSNAISVLRPDGTEERRITGPMDSPGGPIPWDNPAVLSFNWWAPEVFVTNHALLSSDPAHFSVFTVQVGDRASVPALPLILP